MHKFVFGAYFYRYTKNYLFKKETEKEKKSFKTPQKKGKKMSKNCLLQCINKKIKIKTPFRHSSHSRHKSFRPYFTDKKRRKKLGLGLKREFMR